jgi:hypothetical protein
MALPMTRTRTQTALTQLVETLANLKAELAFVEGWLAEPGASAELVARRDALLGQLEALTTTLRVFDPELDVGQVAAAEGWRRSYRVRSFKGRRARYRGSLASVS